jgi:hypothetical protein
LCLRNCFFAQSFISNLGLQSCPGIDIVDFFEIPVASCGGFFSGNGHGVGPFLLVGFLGGDWFREVPHMTCVVLILDRPMPRVGQTTDKDTETY